MSTISRRSAKLTAILLVVAILAAVGSLIYRGLNANRRPKGEIWFYDLKTRQLFPSSDMSVPPIDTKSGPAMGVRAYVYSADSGPKPSNQFIAFLEKFTPETKQAVEEQLKQSGGQMSIGFALERHPGGVLVSPPEEERWFPLSSPEGQRIVETGKKKGGVPNPTPCLP